MTPEIKRKIAELGGFARDDKPNEVNFSTRDSAQAFEEWLSEQQIPNSGWIAGYARYYLTLGRRVYRDEI